MKKRSTAETVPAFGSMIEVGQLNSGLD